MPQPISEHGRLGCGGISHIKIKQPDCNFCLVIRQTEKQQGKGPREADPCKSVCVGASGPHSEPPWERGKEGCLLLTLRPLKPPGELPDSSTVHACLCMREAGWGCMSGGLPTVTPIP